MSFNRLIRPANMIATRCPITAADAFELLKYLRYTEEVNGPDQVIADAIIELSQYGFTPASIRMIMDKALNESGDLRAWREDPQLIELQKNDRMPNPTMLDPKEIDFSKPQSNTPEEAKVDSLKRRLEKAASNSTFSLKGINMEDLKTAMAKLGSVGVSGRQAGKSMQLAISNLSKFSQSCKATFKSAQCGYEGPNVSCDKTIDMCKFLGNEKNFLGFPKIPKTKGFASGGVLPSSNFPGPDRKESFEKAKTDLLKRIAIDQKEVFLTSGKVGPQNEFLNRFNTEYEGAFATKGEPDIYTDEGKGKPGEITKVWIDEEVVYDVKNRKAPKGFDQGEWNLLSVESKRFILKGLGYNKEERKEFENKDRAIDL